MALTSRRIARLVVHSSPNHLEEVVEIAMICRATGKAASQHCCASGKNEDSSCTYKVG
jgi:hypothetical protein